MRLRIAVCLLLCLNTLQLLAQEPEQQQKPFDCMADPERRQFDFWLGQWRVTDEAGETFYGENRVSLAERGCLLREQWRSARGGTGSSINYFNPGDGLWHQQWIDAGASIIEIAGSLQGDSMVMEGTIEYLQPRRSAGFRGRWTPLPDGRVRQFFEEQSAEGEWKTWFEGFYTRSDTGAARATIEELTIRSRGARMPGLIYMAAGSGPHPTVVLLHGIPGNERNLDLAQELRRAGFNVLFFNYRGAWGAEGTYSVQQVDDVAAVLGFLREPANSERYRVDVDRMTLLGHSLGGYAALAAGSRDELLACVGAMSPVNLALWKQGFASHSELGQRLAGYADTLFMLDQFDGEAMAEQLASLNSEEIDTRLLGPGLFGKSIFMVVGDRDPVTPAATMFSPVVEAYGKVEGLSLEHHIISGDHSFSWSRLQLQDLLLNWLQRDCRA